MIRLSGYTEQDIRIVYSGLRPGEKLFEELLAADEHTLPPPHPKLRITQARDVDAEWLTAALHWLMQDGVVTETEVKVKLREWVPKYTPK